MHVPAAGDHGLRRHLCLQLEDVLQTNQGLLQSSHLFEVHVHCCQQPCWCATIISEVHVVITNFRVLYLYLRHEYTPVN